MMNDLLTPETIVLAALAALAARVLIRSRRPADPIEPDAGGGAEELPCRDADRCSWKVHVVGVAHHRCTIVVFGRPVHLKRGDLLLALRPRPGELEQPATSADLPQALQGHGRPA
jgi:hypothetical protein